MTRQKTFKHRVRARMAKTGESYTAARRMLIAPAITLRPRPSSRPLRRLRRQGHRPQPRAVVYAA